MLLHGRLVITAAGTAKERRGEHDSVFIFNVTVNIGVIVTGMHLDMMDDFKVRIREWVRYELDERTVISHSVRMTATSLSFNATFYRSDVDWLPLSMPFRGDRPTANELIIYYSRTTDERPPSPTTIPLIRPHIV